MRRWLVASGMTLVSDFHPKPAERVSPLPLAIDEGGAPE
jgi:hypothetical protein